ncbi:site-specific integrase [Methylosinus sp. RM1]|uniref:tyrosine-type recombinase/integrase n=1 Tax=Methylosinus sp. RM1 TaxID=2583817 RepID=UPI0014090316|nr:integrase arm-type DNA-binding domain-containing protein [Methylosinus sp. RM1]
MAITLRTVAALGPKAVVWDDAVKGFGARRQTSDAVTYVLKYRASGRQRFYTIGRHGSPWTPDTARREARRLLGLVAAGKDPALPLSDGLALRTVIDTYLDVAKERQRPRSYLETERHLRVAWKPLHDMPIADIARRNVASRLAELSGVTVIRARAALSACFVWAIREGLAEANPVTGTNRPPEPTSRSRVLSDVELAVIWRACGDDDYGRIVRLLMLTGQRRDEVGAMTWGEIAGDVWTIPGSRTKNHREHTLSLTAQALALLPEQREGRELVFGAGAGPFSGWSQCKARLDARALKMLRKEDPEAELAGWRLHDLRRTAATVMADRLGVLPHIVEAVLNHVSGHRAGVAGVYNRAAYRAEIGRALEAWGAHVAGIVGAKADE